MGSHYLVIDLLFMGTFKQLGMTFGFDDKFLGYVGSAYAFSSAVSRLSFGVISDSLSRRYLLFFTITFQVLSWRTP